MRLGSNNPSFGGVDGYEGPFLGVLKAKSVQFMEEGLRESERIFDALFCHILAQRTNQRSKCAHSAHHFGRPRMSKV